MAKAQQHKDAKKFEKLLGPTVKAEEDQARHALIKARLDMIFKVPFFGNLATRMKLINSDEWCQTLATDYKNIYYNARFVNMLKHDELVFGLAHEVLHCAYNHYDRRGSRHPKLWNYAADFAINRDLVQHQVGKLITTIEVLYDKKYDGMSSEQIYDDVEKMNEEQLNKLLEAMLDEHLEGSSEEGDGKSGKGPQSMTPEERQQAKDEFRQAMIQAAKQCNDAGHIPGDIKRIIKDLTEPKMNWRELLQQHIQSAVKFDQTWMRPNRKSQHLDAFLPNTDHDKQIDIAVAIDTSGSISDAMTKDFLSEVKGIMEAYGEYKIDLFTFDTKCYNHVTYTSDNVEDIMDYEVKGGGGTDIGCIFDFMKENDIEPKRLISFTDGYNCSDSWGDESYCETLWVIHSNKNPNPPFGQYAEYELA